MLLRDFTKPELDRCIMLCNFTDSELQYFLLKSRDKSNVQIADEMNISERYVSLLATRVKAKLERV